MLKAVKKRLVLLCVLMSLECVATTVFAEELTGEATGERMIQSGVSEEDPYYEFVIKDGVLEAYNGTDNDVVIPEGFKEIGDRVFYYSRVIRKVTMPSWPQANACGFFS